MFLPRPDFFKKPYLFMARQLERFQFFDCFNNVLNIGGDGWVFGYPGVANGAVAIDYEDRPAAHAIPTAVGFVVLVIDTKLANDLAVEVAYQREWRL
jgi:hypothetical protein